VGDSDFCSNTADCCDWNIEGLRSFTAPMSHWGDSGITNERALVFCTSGCVICSCQSCHDKCPQSRLCIGCPGGTKTGAFLCKTGCLLVLGNLGIQCIFLPIWRYAKRTVRSLWGRLTGKNTPENSEDGISGTLLLDPYGDYY
jgi:hypothetical protein